MCWSASRELSLARAPLAQWRAEGRWTRAFDQLWPKLQLRHGTQAGTRQMIEVLQLGRRVGYPKLSAAITQALELGATDAGAGRYWLSASALEAASVPPTGLSLNDVNSPQAVAHFTRPLPQLAAYDTLLESPAMQASTVEASR